LLNGILEIIAIKMSLKVEMIDLPDEASRKAVAEILESSRIDRYQMSISYASNCGDNYMGTIYRIKVSGNREKTTHTERLNLILKVPPPSDLLRQKIPINSLYRREVLAYNVILPALARLERKYFVPQQQKFKTVKCFKASDEELNEIIILEDMNDLDFKMYDRKTSLTYKHMRLVIQSLANFHGLSFALKKADPSRYQKPRCQKKS
jgi:hypothetical protein